MSVYPGLPFQRETKRKRESMESAHSRKKDVTITCRGCGEQVRRYRSARCQKCYFAMLKAANAAKPKREVECKQCGQKFTSHIPHKSFCSQRCRDNNRFNFRRKNHAGKCKRCGESFSKLNPWQTYCSEKCSERERWDRRLAKAGGEKRKPAKIIDSVCGYCKKPFSQPKRLYHKRSNLRTPQFCSHDCHYAHRRTLRGKPPEMGGKLWKRAAKNARLLGGNCCRICGSTDAGPKRKNVAVDHVVPRRLMERWGFDPHQQKNLVCLCPSCHAKKTAAEYKLFKGDLVGFISDLAGMNYPKESVMAAFLLADLSASLVERTYQGIA